ncbi:MAG: type II toxin-antitoxin system VapC family toxin [Acidobacteria bacterium]|nr:type II toxin-antitoxin system VapC family toxin [Acidobacteriota bacterium]MBI3655511.1 type II toxin-antitoxin system VapC family toxin [Acidobacteriota bacterium]
MKSTRGKRKVLDAWAILAWLQDELPAADRVQKMLDVAEAGALQLSMSMINVGEVYYRLAKKRTEKEARAFLSDLKRMPIRTVATPKRLILEAAQLKGRYAISYADAFAVATAIREQAPVVSGDPEFKIFIGTELVEIEWIGANLPPVPKEVGMGGIELVRAARYSEADIFFCEFKVQGSIDRHIVDVTGPHLIDLQRRLGLRRKDMTSKEKEEFLNKVCRTALECHRHIKKVQGNQFDVRDYDVEVLQRLIKMKP